jgi:WD40 repeat protein
MIVVWGCIVLSVLRPAGGDEPGPIDPEEPRLNRAVDFAEDVLPVLKAQCLACHSASVREGGLVLETAAGALAGGDTGRAVVPGKPEESLLLTLAARRGEPVMPPLPNEAQARPLTPRELGLIARWITEGARPSAPREAGILWQPLPESVHPSYALALHPDERFAAVGRGNRLAIFDIVRQRHVADLVDPTLSLTAHRDFVHALDFSPDGEWLASGDFRSVRLWRRRAPLRSLLETQAAVRRLCIDPDGQRVAIGLDGATVLVYELAPLAGRAPPSEPNAPVTLPDAGAGPLGLLSAVNQLLAVEGTELRLFDLTSARRVRTIATGSPIRALLVSSAWGAVVCGHEDGHVRVWSVEGRAGSTTDVPAQALAGPSSPVVALASLPGEGRRLRAVHEDGTACDWDLQSAAERGRLPGTGSAHVVLSADASVRAVRTDAGRVEIRREESADPVTVGGDPRRARMLARRQDDLAVARTRKAAADAHVAALQQDQKEREESLRTARTQVDAKQQALDGAKSKDDEAEAALVAARSALESMPDDAGRQKAHTDAVAARQQAADALRQARDAVVSAERGVELTEHSLNGVQREQEEARRRQEAEAQGEQAAVRELAEAEEAARAAPPAIVSHTLTSGGALLVTADEEGLLCAWDVATGASLDRLETDRTVTAMTGLPEDRVLIGTEDGEVLLVHLQPEWELAGQLGPGDPEGRDLSTSLLEDRVLAVAFSPDSRWLATGSGVPSRSGQLLLWDVERRAIVREFAAAHSDTVFDVSFSRDGTNIATAAADRFARVFEMEGAALLQTLEGHTGHVQGVAWTADGGRLATAGADQTVKIWDARTGEQSRTISTHQKAVESVQFAGVTSRLLSVGGDMAPVIHTTDDGKTATKMAGVADFLHVALATRDGQRVLGAGERGVLYVWAGDGTLVTSFPPE